MRKAINILSIAVVLLAAAACASSAPGSVEAQALVDQSKATVELFKSRNTDSAQLFSAALKDAKGIMVFPQVFEAAVGIGGQGGSGVMVTRDANGTWGYPAFYRLGSGSLGVQLGAQSLDVVYLLMSDTAVRSVIASPGQFGIGAQATLGQMGGGGSSGTTFKGSDIVGFTKGSGVFLGAALSGAYVGPLTTLNQTYYRNKAAPQSILLDHNVANPAADGLRQALIVQ